MRLKKIDINTGKDTEKGPLANPKNLEENPGKDPNKKI